VTRRERARERPEGAGDGPGAARTQPADPGGPVVVGSASRDLAASDPRGWRLGGAVTYAGLALARLGLRPRVLLGADTEAAGAVELDRLRDAGANLRVVQLRRSPVFDNREVGGTRSQLCLEQGDPLPAAALPPEWRAAPAWALVPVADELPPDWASVPPTGAFVALGWQGLLRHLPRGGPVRRRAPQPSALTARADLIVVSRLDLDPDTEIAALGRLLRPGATLVVTDGDAGGIVWRVGDAGTTVAREYRAIPAQAVVDGTGAGDAFLAGLLAARLGHPLAGSGDPESGLRLAAALGSLTVEGEGIAGVPDEVAAATRLDDRPLSPR
jgi:hypothetical protein